LKSPKAKAIRNIYKRSYNATTETPNLNSFSNSFSH